MPGPADPPLPAGSGQPLMSAAALLGAGVAALPERAVLVFDESHVPRRGRRRKPAPFRRVATTGGPVPVAVVAAVGPGAPTAAVSVEFLGHLGVRALVSVGTAGTLTRTIPTNLICPVSAAVSDEGTSARYGSHLVPDPHLAATLASAVPGPAVTALSTDAPMTHTASDIARIRASAEVMEMEAAALFSAAHQLGIAAGALVVTSDRFTDDSWILGDPATTGSEVTSAVNIAINIVHDLSLPADNGYRDLP